MSALTLSASRLRKSYNGIRDVAAPLNVDLKSGEVCALCGANGAGKSTVLKMLAGLLKPSGGSVVVRKDELELSPAQRLATTGFVAPYLQLYEEFSAWEHCHLDARLRGRDLDVAYTEDLFRQFALFDRRHDLLKSYSSGMKQRAKLIVAAYHRPLLLLLDEPTSNIDENGIENLYELVRAHQSNGAIVIIATNDSRDLDHCTTRVSVDHPTPTHHRNTSESNHG